MEVTPTKGPFTHNEIQPDIKNYRSVILSIIGDGPIQVVIQPITIDTMLNNNELNIGDGLNFITCEQILTHNTMSFP